MKITQAGTTPSMASPSRQGLGWVQRDGGPVEEVKPCDVVFFEVGEKHWHGASAQTGMVHIAITEVVDGKADEQYAK